jgi:hypothetical protein
MHHETNSIFINCPFDDAYKPLFDAIIFAVFDCGFVARCTLEDGDSGSSRMYKIFRLVEGSRYAIHDISCTETNENGLPRFNMPLELGVFLGAKYSGGKTYKRKQCVVLDREEYRYQEFISDISGYDIRSHNDDVNDAVKEVVGRIRGASKRLTIPGGKAIVNRYKRFQSQLPELCEELSIEQEELEFNDYATLVSSWLKENG